MTTTEVFKELEELGTEQTRKTYRRHGAGENVYGVKFGDLAKLKKKIKTDHALALDLWESGNYDARNLAMLIADPEKATMAMLDSWVKDLDSYGLTDMLAAYAAKTPQAVRLMEKWNGSKNEWTGRTGWLMLGHIAKDNREMGDDYFEPYLETIERDIHTRKNRVRDAMNFALIGIGVRSEGLRSKALAAAARIGTVEVDHGDTNCKTPDAAEYIRKTVEHRQKKR